MEFVNWFNKLVVAALIACSALAAAEGDRKALSAPGAEAIALDGRVLLRPELPDQRQQLFEDKLAQAETALEAEFNAENLIWVGRRTAYLGRYREAIEHYSRGIEAFPEDPRFLRHRGHRYISTRQLDKAVRDLSKAAGMVAGEADQVEPDGLPNDRGIPTSTLQGNIWYHLGLAHYLKGDYEMALDAYQQGLRVAGNPDMVSAFRYWLYLTQMRLRRQVDAVSNLAAVNRNWDIIENHSYHQLLLLFRGDLEVDDLMQERADELQNASLAYGLAFWHRLKGAPDRARVILDNLLDGEQWASFAYIAAEADRARRASP